MKIFFSALILALLTSCSSTTLEQTDGIPTEEVVVEAKYNTIKRDVPVVNYTKYNSRDNVGEFLDDARFRWEQFAHSIEYCDDNILNIIFFPFKKDEQRQGMPLIYR